LIEVEVSRFRFAGATGTAEHGLTAQKREYSLDQLVDDAAGILDALNVTQTYFAGLSMGGMVGLGLMIRHPHKIKRRCHRGFAAHHDARLHQGLARPYRRVRKGAKIATLRQQPQAQWRWLCRDRRHRP